MAPSAATLSVLIIDDEPREGLAGFMSSPEVSAIAKHPKDVTPDDVQNANVIVIDQFLRTWTFDRDSPATMRPRGGLAVAAVLRSQLEPRATPIVIFTGGLDELGSHLPKAVREPALADEYTVEWVIDRTDHGLLTVIGALAEAVRAMPNSWQSRVDVDRQLLGWFDLSTKDWRADALLDIEQCRPAVGGIASHTSGAAFLRWFTQRILPYPTFLLDDRRAALRLGVGQADFRRLDEHPGESDLSRLLLDAKYSGELASFQGDHWWRAGVDAVLNSIDGWVDGTLDHTAALGTLHDGTIQGLDPSKFRLPVDGDLYTLAPAPREEVVRIMPEPWPVYADDAFALTDDVEEDERLMYWRARAEA